MGLLNHLSDMSGWPQHETSGLEHQQLRGPMNKSFRNPHVSRHQALELPPGSKATELQITLRLKPTFCNHHGRKRGMVGLNLEMVMVGLFRLRLAPAQLGGPPRL
jgi:hypothetical protein